MYMCVSRWICVCVCVCVCVCACMRVWECMHLYCCVHVGVCMQTFKRKTFRDLTSLQSLDSWPHSHGQRFQKKRNVFLICLYNQTTYPPLQIIDVVFFLVWGHSSPAAVIVGMPHKGGCAGFDIHLISHTTVSLTHRFRNTSELPAMMNHITNQLLP